jgi:hypothetical protein
MHRTADEHREHNSERGRGGSTRRLPSAIDRRAGCQECSECVNRSFGGESKAICSLLKKSAMHIGT